MKTIALVTGLLVSQTLFAQESATIAKKYSKARFAFCSTQKLGTLIDFQDFDLTSSGNAAVRVGTKRCNTSDALVWADQTVVVTQINERPQVDLDAQNFVHPDKLARGLVINGTKNAARGTMAGESGVCFFLESENFSDLFTGGYYECE